MPRGRWYLNERPTSRTPLASSAEASVSPAQSGKRLAVEAERQRSLRDRSGRRWRAAASGWMCPYDVVGMAHAAASPRRGCITTCAPAIAWVRVSRVTTSQRRQPCDVLPELAMRAGRIVTQIDIVVPSLGSAHPAPRIGRRGSARRRGRKTPRCRVRRNTDRECASVSVASGRHAGDDRRHAVNGRLGCGARRRFRRSARRWRNGPAAARRSARCGASRGDQMREAPARAGVALKPP